MRGKFVSMLLLFAIMLAAVNASSVKTLQVYPSTKSVMVFNLDNGEKFTGSLSISGGSGNDINFWITNPQGTKILDFGRVNQGKTFEFTAQASGAYTFHFDNSFSLLSTKTVSLSYDITSPAFGGIDFGLLLIIVGIIVILILLSVAVVFYRRKATSKTD